MHGGRQLRARRLKLGLKQGDLARALQISIQQAPRYETAKSSLPVEKPLRLARAPRGATPAYFFDGPAADSPARGPARAG